VTKQRIGVLNFQYSTHNYGAVLQAAALEYMLKSLGHDVEHINYLPLKKSKILKQVIKKILISLRLIKPRENDIRGNTEAFERFRKKYLTRTLPISRREDFETLASGYNTIIVGSDQVWRPTMTSDPEIFFLSYVPNGVNRISYAASFGQAEWEADIDDKITALAKRELAKFKAISCRETSGVEICKRIFDVNAVHVLDPLLQASDDFIESVIKDAKPSSQKLVFYKLDYDKSFLVALKELEVERKVKAHNLYLKDGNSNDFEDVSQWLRNIYDSEIVVSDSFHCICLALRLGKEVFYCPNPSRGQARMDDLFNYLDVHIENYNGNKLFKRLSRDHSFIEKISLLRYNSAKFMDNIS